ncbi:VOC family protein [Aureimonas ureilytica]|uniref:VOC family protein n=1 Tax=Aureimonas ureilytica TaxID=401562 RepID=UPI0003739906|nr:VOC family protein [Aureimonas ureilytica]
MATLALTALLVRDYDEARRFFEGALGFECVEDRELSPDKRWVVVRPKGSPAGGLLLARAADARQRAQVGDQAGGRVFLFPHTDDFPRDHAAFQAKGVVFEEAPRREPYGFVAVFRDLYGNRWDLIGPDPAADP